MNSFRTQIAHMGIAAMLLGGVAWGMYAQGVAEQHRAEKKSAAAAAAATAKAAQEKADLIVTLRSCGATQAMVRNPPADHANGITSVGFSLVNGLQSWVESPLENKLAEAKLSGNPEAIAKAQKDLNENRAAQIESETKGRCLEAVLRAHEKAVESVKAGESIPDFGLPADRPTDSTNDIIGSRESEDDPPARVTPVPLHVPAPAPVEAKSSPAWENATRAAEAAPAVASALVTGAQADCSTLAYQVFASPADAAHARAACGVKTHRVARYRANVPIVVPSSHRGRN